jgi:hypothetical protein
MTIQLLVTYPAKEGIQDPEYYWAPSIAPSGMAFISSDIYPNWKEFTRFFKISICRNAYFHRRQNYW